MENVLQLVDADIPRLQTTVPSTVIQHVQWSVHPNDFWVIGAQPGTGKTDLLCTAAGLARPIRGEQFLFGKNTSEMSEDELVQMRLRIAMIFTTGRLFAHLTVAQNIALPLSYHQSLDRNELSNRVMEALDRTGLAPWQDRRPGQIIRNLHQRIGLARALALHPEVLLIDNPLAGVDPRQGRWWLDFLCKLKESSTIVIAADDFRPWLDIADQFAILKDRHLEIIGGREQVRQSQDTLVRELLTPTFDSA